MNSASFCNDLFYKIYEWQTKISVISWNRLMNKYIKTHDTRIGQYNFTKLITNLSYLDNFWQDNSTYKILNWSNILHISSKLYIKNKNQVYSLIISIKTN